MSYLPQQKGWLQCSKCPLHKTRSHVVLGQGNHSAKVMVIGEGPGSQEDRTGTPFCGASGDMLDSLLDVFEINRGDLFIDNVVACWPFIVDNGRRISRKPSALEVRACKERVEHAIYSVDPYVVIALGGAALQALTGVSTGITQAAGEVFEVEVPGWYAPVKYSVYATFHPAYILRQTPPSQSEKKVNEKHPLYKLYTHFEDVMESVGFLEEAYIGIEGGRANE